MNFNNCKIDYWRTKSLNENPVCIIWIILSINHFKNYLKRMNLIVEDNQLDVISDFEDGLNPDDLKDCSHMIKYIFEYKEILSMLN